MGTGIDVMQLAATRLDKYIASGDIDIKQGPYYGYGLYVDSEFIADYATYDDAYIAAQEDIAQSIEACGL